MYKWTYIEWVYDKRTREEFVCIISNRYGKTWLVSVWVGFCLCLFLPWTLYYTVGSICRWLFLLFTDICICTYVYCSRLVRASPGLRASRGVSNVCCMAVNYKATTDILENVREPLRAAVRYGNLALLQPDLHTIPSSSSSTTTTTSSSLCFDFICTPICTPTHYLHMHSQPLTHIRHGHEWGSLYVIQVGTGEG